nr:MAG: replication associated protein [Cressdnaviricota sp.]
MKKRNYCFTIFTEKHNEIKFIPPMTYLIYQLERCPESGKLHYQGYVEFDCAIRISAVKKTFNCDTMHLETRLGTQDEAIAYCRKEESRVEGPFEFGVKAIQGKRNDLLPLGELATKPLSTWVLDNLDLACKYPNGTKLIKQSFDLKKYSKSMRPNLEVIVLEGPAGCGKTRYAYETFGIENIYKLNTNSNGTLWFDGYEHESILLIDDFKGWIKYTELLTILDIYPYRCQMKGAYTYAAWDKVLITTNYNVKSWYSEGIEIKALLRRISYTKKWDEVVGNTSDNFKNI